MEGVHACANRWSLEATRGHLYANAGSEMGWKRCTFATWWVWWQGTWNISLTKRRVRRFAFTDVLHRNDEERKFEISPRPLFVSQQQITVRLAERDGYIPNLHRSITVVKDKAHQVMALDATPCYARNKLQWPEWLRKQTAHQSAT